MSILMLPDFLTLREPFWLCIFGAQELCHVLWSRDEHGGQEQLCNFFTTPNQQHWCSECAAAGQRMGDEVFRYCLGKDGCQHLTIIVDNKNVKVLVF
jgi:hypothetical protein